MRVKSECECECEEQTLFSDPTQCSAVRGVVVEVELVANLLYYCSWSLRRSSSFSFSTHVALPPTRSAARKLGSQEASVIR